MHKKHGIIGLAVVVLLFAACFVTRTEAAPAEGSKGTIKIGLMETLSGFQAALGNDSRDGFQLYLKEHGNKIGGYDVELFIEDDETTASTALTKATKLVEVNEVDIIVGPSNTACANAIIPYLAEKGVPLIMPYNGGDDITQRLSGEKLYVRYGPTSSQYQHPLGEYAAKELNLKKCAVLAYDFQFGYEGAAGFKRTFEENGGKVVFAAYAPISTTDFSPYLMSMPQDIDSIFFMFTGADASRLANQIVEYGLSEKYTVLAAHTTLDESILPDLDPGCAGYYSANNFTPFIENEQMTKLVELFNGSFGRQLSMPGEEHWTVAMILNEALNKITDLSDGKAIIDAIKAVKLDGPTGPVMFDETGQKVQHVYIRQLRVENGQLGNYPVHSYENVSQFWTYGPAAYQAEPIYGKFEINN